MMCMRYYWVAISVVLPLFLDPLPRTVHVTALLSPWLGGGGSGGVVLSRVWPLAILRY